MAVLNVAPASGSENSGTQGTGFLSPELLAASLQGLARSLLGIQHDSRNIIGENHAPWADRSGARS